jgi:hypothetical protein
MNSGRMEPDDVSGTQNLLSGTERKNTAPRNEKKLISCSFKIDSIH